MGARGDDGDADSTIHDPDVRDLLMLRGHARHPCVAGAPGSRVHVGRPRDVPPPVATLLRLVPRVGAVIRLESQPVLRPVSTGGGAARDVSPDAPAALRPP